MGNYFQKVRIPTPLMLAFTVIIYELKTDLGFYAKGYGEILLRRIGVCNPIVIYESGGKCFFLDKFIEIEGRAEKLDVWHNR